MTCRFPLFLAAACFAVALATPLSAQSTPSTRPQDSSPADTQTPRSSPPAVKKVWTNDDLAGSQSEPGNNSGGLGSPPVRSAQPTAQAAKRNLAWYRAQIAKLQAKLPPLDIQIAALQSALDGKPTGDEKKSVRPYSVRSNDWSVELDELRRQRDDLAAKIDALRDQARRAGVAPNALP